MRHVLRYACAVCETDVIQLSHLPEQLQGSGHDALSSAGCDEAGDCPERQALLDALVRHRWKPIAAAKALGISRATLYRRVHQHRIEMPGRSPV
jgi:transcriptional regulator of acetoin/glycerol metabolism